MKKKKRNPQDSTLRNIRAVNKRLARLEQWCELVMLDVYAMHKTLTILGRGKYSKSGGLVSDKSKNEDYRK